MAELLRIVDDLKARGVGFKVLTGEGAAIDTTRPEGRLIFGVVAAFSEFERERTRAYMAAAGRRGKRLGRPARLDPDKLVLVRRLIGEGKGKAEAARIFGVDSATLRRRLRKKLPREHHHFPELRLRRDCL